MNSSDPLDVTPLKESRSPSATTRSNPPTEEASPFFVTPTFVIDQPSSQASSPSRSGGVATVALGGALTLVGIPMLVLPGPGLLAIGGGLTLMAKGAKNLLGRK